MRFNFRFLLVLLLSFLIVAPESAEAASRSYKRYGKVIKKYSKKRYGKKRYGKKRYGKKRYGKKRYGKKTYRYGKGRKRAKKVVRVTHFNVPSGFGIVGMDVSKYQGTINWGGLKSPETHNFNIGFAFIKASEGTLKKDPFFDYNWLNAAQNGVKRGAYHFYRPNEDVYLQAQNFMSVVRLSPGDLAPVIDVETHGSVSEEKFQRDLKIFISLLEQHYNVKPIIYTGYRFYHNHLQSAEFQKYPFWIAHYGTQDLPFRDHWKFWQFTCTGRVKGINHHVDLNVFKGGYAELNKLCVK